MKLFLNTATTTKCIVLYNAEGIHDAISWDTPGKESENVLKGINQLLQQQQITMKDITDMMVVTGPGSFTGLRIALTVANTMKHVHPHLQLRGVTVGQWFAATEQFNSYVFQVYPSDIFHFDGKGEFLERYPTKDIPEGILVDAGGMVLPSLPLGDKVASFTMESLRTAQVLHRLEEMTEVTRELLTPFYAKHPNISIPKKKTA